MNKKNQWKLISDKKLTVDEMDFIADEILKGKAEGGLNDI